jgi:hypothetical protein
MCQNEIELACMYVWSASLNDVLFILDYCTTMCFLGRAASHVPKRNRTRMAVCLVRQHRTHIPFSQPQSFYVGDCSLTP